MIVRKMLLVIQPFKTIVCWFIVPWYDEHVCLCTCVQSLFLQKVDFNRFVINRIVCTKLRMIV